MLKTKWECYESVLMLVQLLFMISLSLSAFGESANNTSSIDFNKASQLQMIESQGFLYKILDQYLFRSIEGKVYFVLDSSQALETFEASELPKKVSIKAFLIPRLESNLLFKNIQRTEISILEIQELSQPF